MIKIVNKQKQTQTDEQTKGGRMGKEGEGRKKRGMIDQQGETLEPRKGRKRKSRKGERKEEGRKDGEGRREGNRVRK